jgi:hypothetical protein
MKGNKFKFFSHSYTKSEVKDHILMVTATATIGYDNNIQTTTKETTRSFT